MKTCCIDGCASECEKGRRYCREHYLQRKREQALARYRQFGQRTMYTHVCSACGTEYTTTYKRSCGVCKNVLEKRMNQSTIRLMFTRIKHQPDVVLMRGLIVC